LYKIGLHRIAIDGSSSPDKLISGLVNNERDNTYEQNDCWGTVTETSPVFLGERYSPVGININAPSGENVGRLTKQIFGLYL
jgi:hypothetical protein